MRHFVFIAALALPTTSHAEEVEDGLTLMERGAQLFFEGLMGEMEPALEGFQDMAREIGPAMEEMMAEMGPAIIELMDRVDDLSNYEQPEVLPNGDIILRRKQEAPTLPEPGPDGGVEL